MDVRPRHRAVQTALPQPHAAVVIELLAGLQDVWAGDAAVYPAEVFTTECNSRLPLLGANRNFLYIDCTDQRVRRRK